VRKQKGSVLGHLIWKNRKSKEDETKILESWVAVQFESRKVSGSLGANAAEKDGKTL
jgi:hypothetical protein